MSRYCTKCGAVNDDTAQYCVNCQSPMSPTGGYQPMQAVNPGAPGSSMTDYKAMGADKKIIEAGERIERRSCSGRDTRGDGEWTEERKIDVGHWNGTGT